MPPGNKSGQPGGAFPLFGEGEIRAQTTGIDIVTITAPSTMDADFLVCRQYVPEGSTRVDSEKFVVSSAGVLTKFGMYNVEASSAVSTTIGSSMSGTLWARGAAASAATITLPTPSAGAVYGFVQQTANTSGATKYTCLTTGAFIISGDTGCDSFSIASAVEPGVSMLIIGLSATKYAVLAGWPGSSAGVASTGTAYITPAS